MQRNWRFGAFLIVVLGLSILAPVSTSHAGIGDKLKKKAQKEAEKQTDEAVDKATGAAGDTSGVQGGNTGEQEPAKPGDASAGKGGELSSVSTKFDYVPGDSVILFDDFTQDELGEFPAQWRLTQGTFEVAESGGERWLRCASADGRIRMKLPAMVSLPEFWTLEFDFFSAEPTGSDLTVSALAKGDPMVWEAVFPQGTSMAFRTGEILSSTPYDGAPTTAGRHHVMFMARGTGLKAYIDRQRMVSVPEIATVSGVPSEIEIRLWSPSKPMITNVRFAEGCRPAKDMLAEGKLVTYGIHFESGSDVVLPDSAPVLRQIASYLEANPAVKLQITGHTDNVGTPASNLDLSKRRAASVARALSEQLAIASDRFTTDGKGDTQPVASNAKPEGRAMNRRVEFAKQ
jgi:outer membrane protein OmpA-like peptidoglycan-associated protein